MPGRDSFQCALRRESHLALETFPFGVAMVVTPPHILLSVAIIMQDGLQCRKGICSLATLLACTGAQIQIGTAAGTKPLAIFAAQEPIGQFQQERIAHGVRYVNL